MFDRLLEWLGQTFEWFIPFVVIDEFQRGIVLHFGRYKDRLLEPGFHWVWPFGIDQALVENVVSRTNNLNCVVLTTADQVTIQIGVMLRWRINDVKKIYLEVEDPDNAIRDIAYGEVGRAVRDADWDAINTDAWVDALYKAIRRRGFRYGLEVEEVQVTDLSPKVRAFRLISGT